MYTSRLQSFIRYAAAAITFFCAVFDLLVGPSRLEYPVAIGLLHVSSLFDSLLLAATFYCSIGLIRGRRVAWYSSLAVLALATVWYTIESKHLISLLSFIPLLAMVFLLLTRSFYTIKVGRSFRSAALVPVLLVISGITLLMIGLRMVGIASEHDIVHPLAITIATLDHMYTLTALGHHTGRPDYLLSSILLLAGSINYVLFAFVMLQPIADYYRHSSKADRRVLDLLEEYGRSSEDYFKYFPHDKSYFFSQDGEGFIAYGVDSGVCVVLGEPIARNDQARGALLEAFAQHCTSLGWRLAFLGINESQVSLFNNDYFSFLKIGESAIIDLRSQLPSKKRKKVKNIFNRFEELGYTTRFVSSSSSTIMHQMKAISDEWVSEKNRHEYQFAMGYFDELYLKECRIFAIFDNHKKMVGFTNLQPSYSRTGRASVDLIRVSPTAPANTVDFLLFSLLDRLTTEGWSELDLGLAPLSGLEEAKAFAERGLHFAYKFASPLYSFQGVRRYKQKFNPEWEPTYLIYQGHPQDLLIITKAITALLQYKGS